MEIYVTICRKTIEYCSYCSEPIELDELIVCGKLWRRKVTEEGEPRRWIANFRWHARRKRDGQNCWIQSAIEFLERNPVVETRGRKSLQLPEDIKLARLKILRQRARTVARLKELMLDNLVDQRDIDEIIRIGSKIEEMKEKILPLGGLPKSWE